MKSALILASSIAALAHPMCFHQKPEEAGGGGAPQLTIKQQLDAANARIAELEPKAKTTETIQNDLDQARENFKAVAKERDDHKATIATLTGDKTRLEADLKTATDKVTKLETEAKTADERAREKAAANGHAPTPVDAAGIAAGATDGAALYAEYSKLKGREKAAFFREHEKALMSYAKEIEKAG